MDREKMTRIADHYGFKTQCEKLLEEMSELAVCIFKFRKAKDDPVNSWRDAELLGELADVRVMVAQITYLLGLEGEIQESIEFKLNRQLERMTGVNAN